MKRPPGLWVLLSAGVLLLSLQEVYGVRATALIFGKSTTTTTTESSSAAEDASEETAQENSTDTPTNTTKSPLTGVPQVDYILDPNLPKELNGYNLTEYPFYERVPEDIDFKCDGLHDGFYASVPHKCQVYHHCLFGTRYDFLCANYTAFDQKTFICQFVSEVDCVNSKKYWHRNDALYEAQSTTTVKPQFVYTPPSPSSILYPSAGGQSAQPGAQPAPLDPLAPPRRPGGRPRRPARRRRPQYDYYEYDEEYEDDYYEDRPRRRKRPRPRPRPVYDDEYEEYDDERYERPRGNRKPYNRRRPSKDRRKYPEYEDEEETPEEKRPSTERRSNKRRPDDEDQRRRSKPKNRRPVDDEDDYADEPAPSKEKSASTTTDKTVIKPSSGSSLFDRPRAPPKINRPVPKNEASKYAYKPVASKAQPAIEEEYEDYEEPPKQTRKPSRSNDDDRKSTGRLRQQSSHKEEIYEEEPKRTTSSERPKYTTRKRNNRFTSSTKKPDPVDEEYYDDYEEVKTDKEVKVPERSVKSTTSTTTTTTTTTTPKPTTTTTPSSAKDALRPESVVRIVKRPFLPSRGGNPYASRNLQPVGAKAVDKTIEDDAQPLSESNVESMEIKPLFKPSPVIIKVPIRPTSETETDPDFKPVSNRPQTPPRLAIKPNKEYAGPRTTQKPKVVETHDDPLDIDEYDVTLNDALNPTLPNLPVRGYPTGFSGGGDYSNGAYNAYARQRFVEVPSGRSDLSYQQAAKPTRIRFEGAVQQYSNSNPQDHFVNSNTDYKGQYSTIQNYRPPASRITQAFYSNY